MGSTDSDFPGGAHAIPSRFSGGPRIFGGMTHWARFSRGPQGLSWGPTISPAGLSRFGGGPRRGPIAGLRRGPHADKSVFLGWGPGSRLSAGITHFHRGATPGPRDFPPAGPTGSRAGPTRLPAGARIFAAHGLPGNVISGPTRLRGPTPLSAWPITVVFSPRFPNNTHFGGPRISAATLRSAHAFSWCNSTFLSPRDFGFPAGAHRFLPAGGPRVSGLT